METKKIVANNLTYRTLRTAQQYYIRSGEKDVTIERAKRLLETHFDQLLDNCYSCGLERYDGNFTSVTDAVFEELPEMDQTKREDLLAKLSAVFWTGFEAGYIAGAKTMEGVLNAITEPQEEEDDG